MLLQNHAIESYGVGAYGFYSLRESTRQYAGIKLQKTTIKNTSELFNNYEINVTEITPLVGFEYDDTKSWSAAFELGFTFADGDVTNCCDVQDNETLKTQKFYAELSMRYLFFK